MSARLTFLRQGECPDDLTGPYVLILRRPFHA